MTGDVPAGGGPAGDHRRTRLLFVGGLGRSGSTLLELLTGELPGVVSLGEVVHMWQRGLLQGERCGCGEPFRECAFWGEVGRRAFGGWDAFDIDAFLELKQSVDRTRFIPRLARGRPPAGAPAAAPLAVAPGDPSRPAGEPPTDLRERARAYADHYLRLYRAACEVAGATVAVDSSKHASLAFCLRWCPDLDLRVLHVVRDSRAVAYSWTKVVKRPEAVPRTATADGPATADGSATRVTGGAAGRRSPARTAPAPGAETDYMARWAPWRTSVHWNAQNIAFDRLARSGTPTHLVRYEDFVRAPVEELRRIAAFLGIETQGPALDFLTDDHAELSANHTAAGNPMRFRTGRVTLRRDDTWRTALPPAARHLVTAMTAPLLRRYGYLGGLARRDVKEAGEAVSDT